MKRQRLSAEFAGARPRARQLPADLLERALAWGREQHVDLQLVDARGICGPLHLRAALLHTERAFARKRNRANSRATELLLWLSGERQIHRAIAQLGVKRSTRTIGVICFGRRRLPALLRHLDLVRDDTVLEPTPEKLRRLKLTARGARSLPRVLRPLLILERLALAEVPQ